MKGNTMNSNEIRSAIKRSESHSDIVRVAANCTTDDLRALLASIVECDWDMCELDDNKMDVWGWSSETPEGKQDWRLIVQCQPTAEEFCAKHAGACYSKIRDAIAAIDCGDCYPEVDEDGVLTGNLIPGDESGYGLCDVDAFGDVLRHEHASEAVIAD